MKCSQFLLRYFGVLDFDWTFTSRAWNQSLGKGYDFPIIFSVSIKILQDFDKLQVEKAPEHALALSFTLS